MFLIADVCKDNLSYWQRTIERDKQIYTFVQDNLPVSCEQ